MAEANGLIAGNGICRVQDFKILRPPIKHDYVLANVATMTSRQNYRRRSHNRRHPTQKKNSYSVLTAECDQLQNNNSNEFYIFIYQCQKVGAKFNKFFALPLKTTLLYF